MTTNQTTRALIIDDEADIRELLEITLSRMGIETHSAADVKSAKAALQRSREQQPFDLCFTDMKLPDGDGIELVKYIQQDSPQLPVAVITAFGSTNLAITALKAGAFDFVSKPINLEGLRQLVQAALALKEKAPVKTAQAEPTQYKQLLGNSQAMQQLRQKITKLARSQAPVYIHGESGSGKELVAREIHQQSGRHQKPFIAVNCGAIPKELMESEFFGHKKGSFTGAVADKTGLFQMAQGGTLFLDEVADLPLDMQVKLLRVIQEKTVRPVGSEKEITINARILSATHQNLQQAVDEGRFRQDLFFRINVIQISVPALRERPDDIVSLCEYFMDRINKEYSNKPVTLNASALQTLQGYHFPGNVRELENLLERAATLCEDDLITIDDLQLLPHDSKQNISKHKAEHQLENVLEKISASKASVTPHKIPRAASDEPFNPIFNNPDLDKPHFENLDQYLESIERSLLEQALNESRWNKTATAQRLGITFRQLRHKLKKLHID